MSILNHGYRYYVKKLCPKLGCAKFNTIDALFGGVKDKISNYISKDLFEVNDKGWQDKQKQAIHTLSDVSADFSIDLAISGPFALMKGAKNLGKVNKKFDESLKENNVNSDTIVNSNADLKRNGIDGAINKKDIKIKFGNNENQIYHVERHIKDNTKLDVQKVKEEIISNFKSQVDKTQWKYDINIDGYNIEYRIHRLQDGTYNIGTIIVK
jgi:haemagglutination activity domain protein